MSKTLNNLENKNEKENKPNQISTTYKDFNNKLDSVKNKKNNSTIINNLIDSQTSNRKNKNYQTLLYKSTDKDKNKNKNKVQNKMV